MATIRRVRLYPKKQLDKGGLEYSVTFLDASSNELLLNSPGTAGPVKTTSTSYAITASDDVILATAGGITITLPKASDFFADSRGRDFVIRNTAGTSITVAVAASGGNVDAGATATLTTNTAKRYRSDGTNWWGIS